jgi:hypothetical protein
VPQRSNDFQKLVFLVKKVLGGTGATVVESKMLPDLRTGVEQEVDVCIETSVAGQPVMVCLECRDHKRPADVTWIDQMRGKHDGLPTDALVLVSRSGFSKSARTKARVSNIQLLTYAAATEEQLSAALKPTTSLGAITYSFNVVKVVATVEATGDLGEERIGVAPSTDCFDEQGQLRAPISDVVLAYMRDKRLAEILVRDATESHAGIYVEVGNPLVRSADGKQSRLFLQSIEPRLLRRMVKLEVRADLRVRRAKFQLAHGALGNVKVAWGASVLDGRKAMVVAVQQDGAESTVTLHVEKP